VTDMFASFSQIAYEWRPCQIYRKSAQFAIRHRRIDATEFL